MASLPPAAITDSVTTGLPAVRRLARFGAAHGGLFIAAVLGAMAVVLVGGAPAAAAQPSGYRRLAPGVLTVIPADRSGDDSLLRADIPEITLGLSDLTWSPKQSPLGATLVEQGRNRDFPRDIWCLEFAFKPPRQIDIDIPSRELRMERKRVWYLLYSVKNVGGRRIVMDQGDATRLKTELVQEPIRFLPHLVLESVEGLSAAEGTLAYRAYLDRVLPSAIEPIRTREGIRVQLYDSASMAAKEIAPGEERWGVAIWEDVDPRIDYFSIFVRGLTNAIRWRPRQAAEFAADSLPAAGEEHALESLRLDFWRPGDDATSPAEEMSVGNAGLFERRSIGNRVLEALGRPRLSKAAPHAGLELLGLTWQDILVPPAAVKAAAAIDRDSPPSLAPLAKVVRSLAAMEPPSRRPVAVETLLGGMGREWFEDLVGSLNQPLDPQRETLRRGMLNRFGVTEAEQASKRLEALAKVLVGLDGIPSTPARRSAAMALFGRTATRIDSLAMELELARTLVALDDVDFDRRPVLAGGALNAFDTVRTIVDGQPDAAKRSQLIEGILGAEGPTLYAAATAITEGVDHAWVFRYEQ
ncbi:MAG: hypothetical protein DWH79_04465 [Planctomycetota bacterium]|nr:MAG: hypothetical protein DWH79_04465 [Planctomycetota bacterium]